MLKNLVLFFCLFLTANYCLGQNPVQVNQAYDFLKWVRIKDSVKASRGYFDSTLMFPPGCGAPVGIESLRGGNRKMPALYFDTCGHRMYVFDPSNLTWGKFGATHLNENTYKIGGDTITIQGYSAGSGITKVDNLFKLGGALTERTTLVGSDTTGYVNITGKSHYNTPGVFTVTNNWPSSGSAAITGIHNGTGYGVRGSSTAGTGLYGYSTYGSAIEGISEHGYSLRASCFGDTSGVPLFLDQRYTNTGGYNRVYDGIRIWRSQATFPGIGSGMGSRIAWQTVPYDAGGTPEYPYFETKAAIEWKCLDFAGPDRTDELGFQVMGDSILKKVLTLNGRGYGHWHHYGTGSPYETTDTSYAALVVDGAGKMYKRRGDGGGGSGGVSGADPSATIGLTQVNGIATTYMRSDAAPALNQAITPTWTGSHTFGLAATQANPSISIKSTNPVLDMWNTTVVSGDQKRWGMTVSGTGGTFILRSFNDDGSTSNNGIALQIYRNGSTAQDVQIWAGGAMKIKADAANGITLPTLAGAGSRLVVANANGVLSAQQETTTIPLISTGTTPPILTPSKAGDIYIDISAKKLYFATGISSSSDWIIAN